MQLVLDTWTQDAAAVSALHLIWAAVHCWAWELQMGEMRRAASFSSSAAATVSPAFLHPSSQQAEPEDRQQEINGNQAIGEVPCGAVRDLASSLAQYTFEQHRYGPVHLLWAYGLKAKPPFPKFENFQFGDRRSLKLGG